MVLGLDPGRSNLAAISYVYINLTGKHKTGKRKKSWTLSRGEYQTKSGIIEVQKRKLRMLEELEPSFATLALPGSCLSACHEDESFAYCTAYREFSEAWWSVALRRVNSRLKNLLYVAYSPAADSVDCVFSITEDARYAVCNGVIFACTSSNAKTSFQFVMRDLPQYYLYT